MGKLLWKQRYFANEIGLVSIAPNGPKLAVLSMKEKTAMWVVKSRTRDVFEIAGTSVSALTVVPVIGVWKGDRKIAFQFQTDQTLEEISAPKSWRLF
jgi:hypothetical protein